LDCGVPLRIFAGLFRQISKGMLSDLKKCSQRLVQDIRIDYTHDTPG